MAAHGIPAAQPQPLPAMKVLIVLLAALSVSLAEPGYAPVVFSYGAHGTLPQPVQDTPDVAAAKAAHFAAHAKARAATAYASHAYNAPAPVHAYAAPSAYDIGYHGHHAAHVELTPHGVPVDTPEVQAARAANAAAHAAAKHQHLYG